MPPLQLIALTHMNLLKQKWILCINSGFSLLKDLVHNSHKQIPENPFKKKKKTIKTLNSSGENMPLNCVLKI